MKIFVGFDVFTIEKMYEFLWIMTPCILVGGWKSFWAACCLYCQCEAVTSFQLLITPWRKFFGVTFAAVRFFVPKFESYRTHFANTLDLF